MIRLVLKYWANIVWLSLLAACAEKDILLEKALMQAGTNRGELQKVLDRYRNEDKEKYHAARFLIRNMPFYSSYEGDDLEKYLRYYKAYSVTHRKVQYVIDSLEQADGKFSMEQLTRRKDVEEVDSAFLVSHIDWAFKVWREQPWGKNVSFVDFCEYILPHRIGDEPLSLWRESLYNRFNPLLDSLRNTLDASNPLQAAQVVLNHLAQWEYRYTSSFPYGPHVGPDVLRWRTGSCRDLTDGMIYVCRALGIPCGMDQIIVRGDCNSAHFWCFALDKEGHTYTNDFPNEKEWKKCKDYVIKRKGKVYRITYSLNEKLMAKGQKVSSIHSKFKAPLFHDITAEYLDSPGRVIEIPTELLCRKPENGEAVYLCMASKRKWIPVDYIIYEGGDIRFGQVEGDITCILATWEGQNQQFLCDPFYIGRDVGNLHFYTPEPGTRHLSLYMKFHMPAYDHYHTRMVGGVIEGSDDKDFLQADTLYQITRAPYRCFNTAWLNPRKPYRYIRYRGGKNSYSNISELSFYAGREDSIPLRGNVIGCNRGYGSYQNVFDGRTDTPFGTKDGNTGWVGLDFGKLVWIEKAVYTPCNRLNFIYKGNEYELFYWEDGKWNSLGRRTAMADSLAYQAPTNALLYLKCYNGGKEERIFEYKDGTQIFR